MASRRLNRRIRAVVLALAVTGALGLVSAPVAAQVAVPGQHDVLDGVSPAVPRLVVQVVTTVGEELLVANPTATALVVTADTGEPFLRIGPGGVQANLASPAWYRSNDPAGVAPLPAGLDPSAPPRWASVSTDPSWGWFDPRLSAAAHTPARVGASTAWTVPATYGQERVTITGHIELRRSTGLLVAKLVSPQPPFAGLLVGAVQGSVPGIFLSVSGPQTVVVLGQSGEPFLRVRRDGVEVNRASPTWALTAASRGEAPDGVISAAAQPRWEQLDRVGRISWLEPRASYPPGAPPADVQARTTVTDLLTWSIPLLVDSVKYDVSGVTSWVPNLSPQSPGLQAASAALHAPHRGEHRTSLALTLAVAVAAALLAVGAGVLWRRRVRPG